MLKIPNPRNLNYVLGLIGNAMLNLNEEFHTDIPPIQFIVINKKQELPGVGIEGFIGLGNFNKLNKSQKKKLIDFELTKIYTHQDWDWVLDELSLGPVDIDVDEELLRAKNIRGGGESESHKNFKKYISQNPPLLGLKSNMTDTTIEYGLPSGDTIDVLFTNKDLKIGVEVKSKISDTADIMRGIFQCVKYKYLLEAEQIVNNELPNSQVILALEGNLPIKLVAIKNLLGIEVVDGISIMS